MANRFGRYCWHRLNTGWLQTARLIEKGLNTSLCLMIMAYLLKTCHLKVYIHVLFLSILFSCDVRSQKQQILYVKISANHPCPNISQIAKCQTLDWYANKSNCSLMSNKQMLLQEGVHLLQKIFNVSGCTNFTMTGNGSALWSSDGYFQPTSIVNRSKETNSGLFF